MAEDPIISFRAGMCDVDVCGDAHFPSMSANGWQESSQPYKVKPKAEPGYIFLYKGDDGKLSPQLWRPALQPSDRSQTLFTSAGDPETSLPTMQNSTWS
jgi:hypothetical protein